MKKRRFIYSSSCKKTQLIVALKEAVLKEMPVYDGTEEDEDVGSNLAGFGFSTATEWELIDWRDDFEDGLPVVKREMFREPSGSIGVVQSMKRQIYDVVIDRPPRRSKCVSPDYKRQAGFW